MIRKLYSVLIFSVLFFSCEDLPDLSDILDSVAGGQSAEATIVSHLETFTSSTASISWEGDEDGFTNSYSYRLVPLSYLVDTVNTYTSWSDWDGGTSVELLFLDEGSYEFYLKGRINKDNVVSTSTTFTVDAITQPTLRIYPLKQTVSPGSQFHIYLYAEHINAVRGIEVQLDLSNDNITYSDWATGGVFSTGSEYSLFPSPSVDGQTIILSSVVGGSGLSGSHLEIAKLTFTFSGAALSSTTIGINVTNSLLRDVNNQDIQIIDRVQGIIEGGE